MGLESQQALCLGWRASRGRGRGCEPLSGGSWRSPLAEAQGGGGGGWVDTRGACRARGLDQARGLVSRPGEGEVGGASAAGSTQQDALGGVVGEGCGEAQSLGCRHCSGVRQEMNPDREVAVGKEGGASRGFSRDTEQGRWRWDPWS